MRIDTVSGLRGTLIAYRADAREPAYGVALVLRDRAMLADKDRPYSTHRIETWHNGTVSASAGNYDLTLPEALADFEIRSGATR